MLKNLVSRFLGEDTSHPLGSDSSVGVIISDIPLANPERTLLDVGNWLDEAEHADELDPVRLVKSVRLLDNFAFPIFAECLGRYFDPHGRDHFSEPYWKTLTSHCRRAALNYTRFVRQQPKPIAEINTSDRKQLTQPAARAMYWLMREKQLLRLRYRSPDIIWWTTVHDLLARAHAYGIGSLKTSLFAELEGETTVWQEYTQGLYLDLAPIGSLPPDQVETLSRVLRWLAPQLMLKSVGAEDSYAIDLTGSNGLVKVKLGDAQGSRWRFLNPTPVYGQLLRLASQIHTEQALPSWLVQTPSSVADTEAMLRTLILHWSKQPPKRRGKREPSHEDVLVVHGLALARRMVACSDFARSGRSLQYDSDLASARRDRLESHFTTIDGARLAEEKQAPDPLEVLRKLELSGDRAMMEKWKLLDVSNGGLGATVPLLRAVHRVGALVAYRFADQIEWCLGIVRRIGSGGDDKTSVGLESLSEGPSSCAQARPVNQAGKTSWQEVEGSGLGYLDAILVSPAGDEVVLPAGAFVADLPVTLRVAGKERVIILDKLVEKGDDFERVRFRSEN